MYSIEKKVHKLCGLKDKLEVLTWGSAATMQEKKYIICNLVCKLVIKKRFSRIIFGLVIWLSSVFKLPCRTLKGKEPVVRGI